MKLQALGAMAIAAAVAALGAGCSDYGPNEYDVQITCQGLARDSLKNPTTAEFSGEEQSESSASGLVMAENALGGKVTYKYRCSRSGDTVTLEGMTER